MAYEPKDWPTRAAVAEFGAYVEQSYEAQLSESAIKAVLVRLAQDLAHALARHGYRPDMKTLVLMQKDGEWFRMSKTYAAKIHGDFTADPKGFLYELDAEVQKLRDLLASLVETKDAIHQE
jgi:hypothetical protein